MQNLTEITLEATTYSAEIEVMKNLTKDISLSFYPLIPTEKDRYSLQFLNIRREEGIVRNLKVTLTSEKEKYVPTTNEKAFLRYRNANKKEGEVACTTQADGTIAVPIPNDITDVIGMHWCDIVLKDDKEGRTSTENFILRNVPPPPPIKPHIIYITKETN